MRRLDQKVACVTGGASGLGKAIAERLKSEGATVVITDVQGDLGRETAAQHGFVFLEQDVADESRWREVVTEIEKRFSRLDILVNNAGISSTNGFNPETTQISEWRKIFAVNVEGVVLGCREAIAAMKRAGGGSIVNVSSIAALRATPTAMSYGASKAAVRQLTKSVARHCADARMNIRCNSVHPGIVQTPIYEQAARKRGISIDELFAELRAGAAVPLGEFSSAEDIAAAVAFLASDDARHVTGTKIIVDGGLVDCAVIVENRRRE